MASQSGYDDAGSSGLGISSSKLGSKYLPSKRLLGTGLASVGYETELNGTKCARKDFIGVPTRTFRREAARLVGLEDHINVVKTLDWTENKMSSSLVLQYMDDDLLGFLQKRKQSQGSLEAGSSSGNQSDLDSRNTIELARIELRESLGIMLEIARGMEFLADKGIRHGNLKPKNILVSRTNDHRNSLSVKVADFGLVRTRRKSTSFASRQARKLDMARWTAPEILQVFLLEDKGETSSESDSDEDCTDSSDVIDSEVPEWRELGADVYSFAVTCSQILTGEDPYPGNLNWKELGVNIVRHGLKPTLPAACPSVLRELLVSCWGFGRLWDSFPERPSFSHICRTLVKLHRQMRPVRYLHPARESADAFQESGSVVGAHARERANACRARDCLREPITVEDLWGPERLQDPLHEDRWIDEDLPPALLVAQLISSTRTVVRRRAEWTQLREELELMLPDMLRIRNRWVGYLKTVQDSLTRVRPMKSWLGKLSSALRDTLLEVGKYQQQEDVGSLFAAFTEPRRVSKHRHDINQLAKQQTEIMLDLNRILRQAQVLAKEKKSRRKLRMGVLVPKILE